MERMMKKMGLNMEEIGDVKKVVIHTDTKEIIILDPSVTIMNVQGEKTYQIQGRTTEKILKVELPEEDVQLVMEQASISREQAIKALEEADGEPAEAIIRSMG